MFFSHLYEGINFFGFLVCCPVQLTLSKMSLLLTERIFSFNGKGGLTVNGRVAFPESVPIHLKIGGKTKIQIRSSECVSLNSAAIVYSTDSDKTILPSYSLIALCRL